jgi:hypothetical protein
MAVCRLSTLGSSIQPPVSWLQASGSRPAPASPRGKEDLAVDFRAVAAEAQGREGVAGLRLPGAEREGRARIKDRRPTRSVDRR